MDCQGEGVHELRTQVSREEKRLKSGEGRELSSISSMWGGGVKIFYRTTHCSNLVNCVRNKQLT